MKGMPNKSVLSKDHLLAASRRLTVPERVDLFLALREELRNSSPALDEDAVGADEFSPEQLAELERRLARHEADPGSSVSWESIERELDERYGQDR